MKSTVLRSISLLMIMGIFSFVASTTSAAGLQNYLQEPEITKISTSETTKNISQKSIEQQDAPSLPTIESSASSDLFTNILELVVAGIVGSALILAILVLFFGRWIGNNEKKAVKKIRIEMEQEKEHIISAATTIKEQEKETTELVHNIRDDANKLSSHKEAVEKVENEMIQTSQQVKAKSEKIEQVTEKVSNNFDQIQNYWETQLGDTISTIKGLQSNLDQGFNQVEDDIDKMQQQKVLSQELLQDFLNRHNEQSELITNNTQVSEEVSKNLDETLKESKQLVMLLKRHQENAEKSLKNFTTELTAYEEQAYEQFDTSFQVADLARQELTANVDESRKHIKTMRRHEEQSHTINTQTQKNLESLDYSKIMKLSHTIDSAQDMFTDMRSKVEETKQMLDELKDIETDVRKTASNVESKLDVSNSDAKRDDEKLLDDVHLQENLDEELTAFDSSEYKMVSGDNTPISFFKNIKKK